jgi:hypothetical protein
MPSNFDLATNGMLVSSTPIGGNRKIEHFHHGYPICTYCVALCCTEYQIDEQSWEWQGYQMPVFSYALPSNPSAFDAFRTLGPQVLTVLCNLYGVYPFIDEKLGNADFGWYGAMEHQTCCMYSPYFHDEWVIAHEIGHQWWGDMITCHTFNHIWLNEGFASYTEALYFEALFGEAAYFDYMQSQIYYGGGSIYVENLVYEEIYNGDLSYDKASWVLHMLRGVIGDSLFFEVVRDYGNSEHRYGTATTQNFIDVANATLGEDIGWFVNEWIYGEGHPEYEISWECTPNSERGGYDLLYAIEQVQPYGTYFRMPIRTTFVTTGADLDTIIWNQGPIQVYELWLPDSLINVIFDPDEWILRQVDVVPFTMHMITVDPPDGYVGIPYEYVMEAAGGEEPYHWRFMGGDLPVGLTFDTTTATIAGTPTWPANYYFTIRVEDDGSPPYADQRNLIITIHDAPADCGDVDENGSINVSDIVFLIDFVFGDGPPPDPVSIGDVDCNGVVNVSDVVYLIAFVFGDGVEPCADCP